MNLHLSPESAAWIKQESERYIAQLCNGPDPRLAQIPVIIKDLAKLTVQVDYLEKQLKAKSKHDDELKQYKDAELEQMIGNRRDGTICVALVVGFVTWLAWVLLIRP